jgi:hypothetical protein
LLAIFGIPEFMIVARTLVAFRATMPKTTVRKHNSPLAPKGEIRLAKKRLVAPPTGDAVLAKYPDQAQLGGFASAQADQ